MPFTEAGMRTEPPVSEPSAAAARPEATATPEPDEEPPGTRAASRTQGGVPKWGLMPMPEKASSVIVVRPRNTAPAASRRATTGASSSAGARSSSTLEPAALTSPSMSSRSLTAIGTPCSGPVSTPARSSRLASCAWRRARSAVMRR